MTAGMIKEERRKGIMRMAKLKNYYGNDFIYVNPDRVFSLEKHGDEHTTIRASALEDDYIIVNGTIDGVAARLEYARK